MRAAIASSMILPDPIINDLDGDLRHIPLIIASLYGGYLSGGIALACFMLTRFFIGPAGWELAFLAITAAFGAASIFRSRFAKQTPWRRLFITTGLTLAGFAISWLSTISQHGNAGDIRQLAIVCIIQLLAMGMTVFLMEVTIKSKQMQRQLLSVEKMNLASHLASSVAHEVRSPLTVVKGYLQLVSGSMEGKNRIYIETSLAELKRAEYVINDFLNFAKPQLEKMEVVQVADMLHQIRQSMSETVGMYKVDLQVEAEEGLRVEADRYKIIQALAHIIKNAVEASYGGQVSVYARRVSDKIQISVCDNGEGMTPDELTSSAHRFILPKATVPDSD